MINVILPAARVSDYSNRAMTARNIGYYVEGRGGRLFPVVNGKTYDDEPDFYKAMAKAKALAGSIAGSMRDRGIRARAIEIHNTIQWR